MTIIVSCFSPRHLHVLIGVSHRRWKQLWLQSPNQQSAEISSSHSFVHICGSLRRYSKKFSRDICGWSFCHLKSWADFGCCVCLMSRVCVGGVQQKPGWGRRQWQWSKWPIRNAAGCTVSRSQPEPPTVAPLLIKPSPPLSLHPWVRVCGQHTAVRHSIMSTVRGSK